MPVVMDADRIGRTLTRIAHDIVERNRGVEDLALVGVRTPRRLCLEQLSGIGGDLVLARAHLIIVTGPNEAS